MKDDYYKQIESQLDSLKREIKQLEAKIVSLGVL